MADRELVFYMAPNSRAGIVHWMLEELGVPYRTEVLNLKKAEHKAPGYLAINPMGKVPAIKHGDTVVTEAAAICCYLADAFPQAGLAPALDDPQRGTYLRWMFFAPSCIEPAMGDKAFQRPPAPASTVGYGDFDTVMEAAAGAVAERRLCARRPLQRRGRRVRLDTPLRHDVRHHPGPARIQGLCGPAQCAPCPATRSGAEPAARERVGRLKIGRPALTAGVGRL